MAIKQDEAGLYNTKSPNAEVEELRKQAGPYIYGEADPTLKTNLEYRPTSKYINGNIYTGQWIIGTTMKEGKGVYIWADGKIYEGWWQKGKRNGRGRQITADGSVYDGEWVEHQ